MVPTDCGRPMDPALVSFRCRISVQYLPAMRYHCFCICHPLAPQPQPTLPLNMTPVLCTSACLFISFHGNGASMWWFCFWAGGRTLKASEKLWLKLTTWRHTLHGTTTHATANTPLPTNIYQAIPTLDSRATFLPSHRRSIPPFHCPRPEFLTRLIAPHSPPNYYPPNYYPPRSSPPRSSPPSCSLTLTLFWTRS